MRVFDLYVHSNLCVYAKMYVCISHDLGSGVSFFFGPVPERNHSEIKSIPFSRWLLQSPAMHTRRCMHVVLSYWPRFRSVMLASLRSLVPKDW